MSFVTISFIYTQNHLFLLLTSYITNSRFLGYKSIRQFWSFHSNFMSVCPPWSIRPNLRESEIMVKLSERFIVIITKFGVLCSLTLTTLFG